METHCGSSSDNLKTGTYLLNKTLTFHSAKAISLLDRKEMAQRDPTMSHQRRSSKYQEISKVTESGTLVLALPDAGCVTLDKSSLFSGVYGYR